MVGFRPYARHLLIEALGRRGVHDDRLLALLRDWLSSDDDMQDAILALGDYQDPATVPDLLAALDRALDRGSRLVSGDIEFVLTRFGAWPTEEQRAKLAALSRKRGSPLH